MPFRTIDFKDRDDRKKHDQMVELVERMIKLKQNESSVRTPGDKTSALRQINALNRQIDKLVSELYELSDMDLTVLDDVEASRQAFDIEPVAVS